MECPTNTVKVAIIRLLFLTRNCTKTTTDPPTIILPDTKAHDMLVLALGDSRKSCSKPTAIEQEDPPLQVGSDRTAPTSPVSSLSSDECALWKIGPGPELVVSDRILGGGGGSPFVQVLSCAFSTTDGISSKKKSTSSNYSIDEVFTWCLSFSTVSITAVFICLHTCVGHRSSCQSGTYTRTLSLLSGSASMLPSFSNVADFSLNNPTYIV